MSSHIDPEAFDSREFARERFSKFFGRNIPRPDVPGGETDLQREQHPVSSILKTLKPSS